MDSQDRIDEGDDVGVPDAGEGTIIKDTPTRNDQSDKLPPIDPKDTFVTGSINPISPMENDIRAQSSFAESSANMTAAQDRPLLGKDVESSDKRESRKSVLQAAQQSSVDLRKSALAQRRYSSRKEMKYDDCESQDEDTKKESVRASAVL